MSKEIIGYTLDGEPHLVKRVKDRLHDSKPLTPDEKRDLALALNLFLHNLQPVYEEEE